MNGPTDARLQRLLGGDHLASLRKRLRRRFERIPIDSPCHYIRIDGLAADEHATLASLLGRPARHVASMQIDVRLIDAALQRAGIASSLRDALEQLDGPIVDLTTTRLRREHLWLSVVDRCRHPDLVKFLRVPSGVGLLKRLAGRDAQVAAELCRGAEAVLQRLPAKGLTRSQLAAETLGNAHALDNGRPIATMVLAIWRGLTHSTVESRQPAAPEPTREIWAAAGVLVNELARPVLFLNLPTAAPQADLWRRGEPAYLSLRALLRSRPPWDVGGRTIYVCENPNLVAIAADKFGADCAPLVCVEGMPAAAQRCLLSQLSHAGARLCYHGDFDWPGLHIGNCVVREFNATPWRFRARDYVAAVRGVPTQGQYLTGKEVEASWDEALASAMRQYRISFAEEALTTSLLQDLDCAAPA